MTQLSTWRGAPLPTPTTLEGEYTRLVPLNADTHGPDLYEASSAAGAEERFRYLFEPPPQDYAQFQAWAEKAAASRDPMFFAVIDKATDRAEGRQALMRIDPAHGVIEIGSILWGPAMSRSRIATEALYLFANHIFELGYRRFEWKCNALNAPSRRAALRFGFQFEGIFRQHMVVKGENRDTAWFSMTDSDWLIQKPRYQAWLSPENFDEKGQQRRKL